MPYNLSDFEELPKPQQDARDLDLGGGVDRRGKLSASLRKRLDTVGGGKNNDRSQVDDGVVCSLLDEGLNPADALATFIKSKRGVDAAERKDGHFHDYLERTLKHAAGTVKGTKMAKPETDNQDDIHLTDLGNSERLAALFGDKVRYCADQRAWYCWNGQYWKKNDITGVPNRVF